MEKKIKELYAFVAVDSTTKIEYIAEIKFGRLSTAPAMTPDKANIPLLAILVGEQVKEMKLKKFVFEEEISKEELGKMLDKHNQKIWNGK